MKSKININREHWRKKTLNLINAGSSRAVF